MMAGVRRFFLARRTVLVLILLLLASVVAAYVFPQRLVSSPEYLDQWGQATPAVTSAYEALGLDHVYTTWWFAAILLLFFISIILSTIEQMRLAIRRTFGLGAPPVDRTGLSGISEDKAASIATEMGYRHMAEDERGRKFIRHPWGYWGGVMLHAGMALVIVSSLFMVLLEKRGLINIVEGEIFSPHENWTREERGKLAGPFILPAAVELEDVAFDFWDTDDLKSLETDLSFLEEDGTSEEVHLGINDIGHYKGLRVYQGTGFGHAFLVEFEDDSGATFRGLVDIPYPVKRDKASYGNFEWSGLSYRVKAKYYADVERTKMKGGEPLLVLRLMGPRGIIGEAAMVEGQDVSLGPLSARLLGVRHWASFIFVDGAGMPGIFLGFFIIITGAGLYYFTPPRELYIIKDSTGCAVSWRASRFAGLFAGEFDELMNRMRND